MRFKRRSSALCSASSFFNSSSRRRFRAESSIWRFCVGESCEPGAGTRAAVARWPVVADSPVGASAPRVAGEARNINPVALASVKKCGSDFSLCCAGESGESYVRALMRKFFIAAPIIDGSYNAGPDVCAAFDHGERKICDISVPDITFTASPPQHNEKSAIRISFTLGECNGLMFLASPATRAPDAQPANPATTATAQPPPASPRPARQLFSTQKRQMELSAENAVREEELKKELAEQSAELRA